LTTLAGLMGRRSREGRRWGIGVLIIVGILGLPTAGLVATNHLLRQSGEQRANDSNAVAASTLAFEVGQSYRQRLALFSEIPDRPDVAAGLSDGDPALTAQALRAALIDGGFCQLELRSPGIRAMSVSSGGPCWAPPAPATGAAGIRALGATMVGSRAFVGFDVLGDFPGHPGASLQAVFPVDALTATVLPGTGIHATVVDGLRIVSSSNPALVGRLIASPFARAMALAGRPASATLYSPSLRTEVLDAFRPVPGTGLGVFYSETTAVAYAATNHVSRVLLEGYLVLLAIIVSLAGLVIVMLRRRDRAAQRSEDELRASEERYRLLIAGVTDYAILALDVDGRVTTWNSGAERIKGYRAEEIIGRHCSVFYPPEDISAGIPAAELVAATANGSVEAEGWRLRKDGTRFWGSVVITAIFDDDHHPAGFTKVTRDITERHTHAQLLAHERRRLLAAESIGRVGSWELDLLTKTAVWSDSFLDLYGQDRGDLAAARDCVHPDDLAKLDAAILGCATTGAPFQVRYRIKRVNDGELRWLEALGERDAAGPHTSLIGATIDVTDQVLRSRADTEARFREVFDTAPIGMAIIDLSQLSSGLLRVNPAMCALTGRTDDELVVLDLDAISDPADAAADHRMLARLRSGQDEVVQGEKRFARPDGSTVWGKFSMSAVSAGDGTDAYAVCLVENITARKQAEEALVHESLHDPLTGLANRTLLHDRIDHALAASTRSHRPIGLVYIDLELGGGVGVDLGHAPVVVRDDSVTAVLGNHEDPRGPAAGRLASVSSQPVGLLARLAAETGHVVVLRAQLRRSVRPGHSVNGERRCISRRRPGISRAGRALIASHSSRAVAFSSKWSRSASTRRAASQAWVTTKSVRSVPVAATARSISSRSSGVVRRSMRRLRRLDCVSIYSTPDQRCTSSVRPDEQTAPPTLRHPKNPSPRRTVSPPQPRFRQPAQQDLTFM
jgi:PAS domain S-box-containing protein